MNMSGSLTAMDAIVLIAVLFALLFVAAWMVSPNLRTWIERPKYRFLTAVQGYDHQQNGGTKEKRP